jgi:hypothetical protein
MLNSFSAVISTHLQFGGVGAQNAVNADIWFYMERTRPNSGVLSQYRHIPGFSRLQFDHWAANQLLVGNVLPTTITLTWLFTAVQHY